MFTLWLTLPRIVMHGLHDVVVKLCYIINQNERIITIMTNTQADIDALTAQLGKATDEIKMQIASLEAQIMAGVTLDLTALKAAAGILDDINPDIVEPDPDPTV